MSKIGYLVLCIKFNEEKNQKHNHKSQSQNRACVSAYVFAGCECVAGWVGVGVWYFIIYDELNGYMYRMIHDFWYCFNAHYSLKEQIKIQWNISH